MPVKKAAAKKPVAKKAAAAKKAAPKKAADVARARKPSASAREAARLKLHERINVGIGNAKPLAQGKIFAATEIPPYRVIPTGSLLLDYETGVGGYVRGRTTESYSAPGMGKTSMALIGLANAQREYPDDIVGFIDVEGTIDKRLAVSLGVDLKRMDIFSPTSAEEVADILKEMIRSGLYSMIVIDSVGALISEIEKEKDADENVVATQAKIVTRMINIATSECRKYDVALFIINQIRADIGSSGHGPSTTTAGGFALKHASSLKLRLKPGGAGWQRKMTVDKRDYIISQLVGIEIERNKCSTRGGVARVELFLRPTRKYGPVGLRPAEEAFILGQYRTVGAIIKTGSRYTLPDGQVVIGEDAAIRALEDDPDLIRMVRDIALKSVADSVIIDDDFSIDEQDDDDDDEIEALANLDEDEPGTTEVEEEPKLHGVGLPLFRKVIDSDEIPTISLDDIPLVEDAEEAV